MPIQPGFDAAIAYRPVGSSVKLNLPASSVTVVRAIELSGALSVTTARRRGRDGCASDATVPEIEPVPVLAVGVAVSRAGAWARSAVIRRRAGAPVIAQPPS